MAGVMVFTPCSGHEAEAQRHQGLAEIAPHGCWHAAGVVLLALEAPARQGAARMRQGGSAQCDAPRRRGGSAHAPAARLQVRCVTS